MASVKDLSESKYLAKEDVGSGMLVTITGYTKADVSRDCDPTSIKHILKFAECKPLVLNKTNGNRIADIAHQVYGITRDDSEDEDGVICPTNTQFRNWVGKKIILWNNPDIEFQGEVRGGIRVRSPQGQVNTVKQAAAQAAQELGNHYDGSEPTPPA